MHRFRLARHFALFAFAALYPALGLALNETYEGVLQPDGPDRPIPIVVVLRETGGIVKGSVKTTYPLQGNALIESGRNLAGRCTVEVVLAKDVTLRLDGNCDREGFKGTYLLRDYQKRQVTRGDFRLERKAPETAANAGVPYKTSTAASCLKANSQCLAACPRGDSSVEFLCANHCRTRLKSCKESAAPKLPPESP